MSSPHSMKTGSGTIGPAPLVGRKKATWGREGAAATAWRRAQQRQGAWAGADDDDVGTVVPPVRGRHGGTVGSLPHGGRRRAHLERRSLPCRTGPGGIRRRPARPIRARTARGQRAVIPPKSRRRLGRREPLGRRARGRQRAGDGVERGLVAERHLARGVQEPSPAGALQVVPEVPGPQRHLDVERVRVAQPEDASVALGARPFVADGAGGLQDDDVPPPPRQRPRGAQPEEPGADDDAAAVGWHGDDHRNAAGAASLPRMWGDVAVRSAAVTSGMDVSMHPTHDTPGPPEAPDTSLPEDSDDASGRA